MAQHPAFRRLPQEKTFAKGDGVRRGMNTRKPAQCATPRQCPIQAKARPLELKTPDIAIRKASKSGRNQFSNPGEI